MNKETKKKVKLIVRTFLAANKGKSYTSKQICDFINENNLGIRGGVMSSEIGTVCDNTFCYQYGITRERKNGRNVWDYSVVE